MTPPSLVYKRVISPAKLRAEGPNINVTLGLPKRAQTIRGHNQEERVRALIDTGATMSNISDRVAQKMGLVPINRVPSGGVHGHNFSYVYTVDFTFTGSKITFVNWPVLGFTWCNQYFDMLIGRDVLGLANMVYGGHSGQLILEFPVPQVQQPPPKP